MSSAVVVMRNASVLTPWINQLMSAMSTMQGMTRRGDKEKEAVLFGEAVRRAREKKGMNQSQLAGAAGLSAPTSTSSSTAAILFARRTAHETLGRARGRT